MRNVPDMIKTTPTTTLSALLRSSMMTRAERTQGRFMRAPDGHTDPAPAGDLAPAGDTPPADPAAPAVDPASPPVDDGTALGTAGDPPVDPDAPKEGDAAPAMVAPEAYDLKAPEGMDFDADALAIAEPIFREMNLDNESAQKLTTAYAQIAPQIAEKAVTADRAAQEAAVVAGRKAWADEAKADPEIGGANWDASIAASARALDRLGAPKGSPFRELLNASGLGNHVEMIRMFANVGKAIGEDPSFVDAKTTKAKTTEEKFYGTA